MTFEQRATARVDVMLERIAASWFPGAPYDAGNLGRLDDEIGRALRSGVISRVNSACDKFEAHVVRKLTIAKLETKPTKGNATNGKPDQADLFGAGANRSYPGG